MLDIIGIVLLVGGIVALVKKPAPGATRKTEPGVAIAMIIVGICVVVLAEVVIPLYLRVR